MDSVKVPYVSILLVKVLAGDLVTRVILVGLVRLLNHEHGMLTIKTEERAGSLIAAAGIVWTTYAATENLIAVSQLPPLPPGPLEIAAVGILVWLHAKWRRSLKN